MEKVSYALGMSIGQNLREAGVEKIDGKRFLQGIEDVLSGAKLEMSADEAQQAITEFLTRAQREKSEKDIEAGKKFLAENAKRESVTVLPSGLQYEVLTSAIGQKPTAADAIKCHYHGTLIDGTVFDSSVRRGQPATFGVSQVIQGWVEALQLMSVGSKWRLYIPYNLAYGERGAGSIPPFSTLIFDVELLEIVKK